MVIHNGYTQTLQIMQHTHRHKAVTRHVEGKKLISSKAIGLLDSISTSEQQNKHPEANCLRNSKDGNKISKGCGDCELLIKTGKNIALIKNST